MQVGGGLWLRIGKVGCGEEVCPRDQVESRRVLCGLESLVVIFYVAHWMAGGPVHTHRETKALAHLGVTNCLWAGECTNMQARTIVEWLNFGPCTPSTE